MALVAYADSDEDDIAPTDAKLASSSSDADPLIEVAAVDKHAESKEPNDDTLSGDTKGGKKKRSTDAGRTKHKKKKGEGDAKKFALPSLAAALASSKPSFLARGEGEAQARIEAVAKSYSERERVEVPQTTAPRVAAEEEQEERKQAAEKEKETTWQKNKRQQKLGQAKFTVKSNRDCPDVWRPSG